ncbi:MAG: CapA family protein [Actinobacteria bacterium]|nr:CapA family protein [Actinomycetota bacterium]
MKNTGKKYPGKRIYKIKAGIGHNILFFTVSVLLFLIASFTFSSCCIPAEKAGSLFEALLQKAGFKDSTSDTIKENNGNPDIAETDETIEELPQAITVNVYIDSLVDYRERNIILDKLAESLDEYDLKGKNIQNDNMQSDKSGNKYEFINVWQADSADIIFKMASGADIKEPDTVAGPFYYAAVTSFYSLLEEISIDDFKEFWNGTKTSLKDIHGNDVEFELALDRQVFKIMETIFGKCRSRSFHLLNKNDIEESLKKQKIMNVQEENGAQVISIIPFEEIRPYHKVLKVEGLNILYKNAAGKDNADFLSRYPFVFAVDAVFKADKIDEELEKIIREKTGSALPSNRQADDITSVMMTGVTALTRQVAAKMDQNGILYPAEKIRDTLLDADITHISNEVSFMPDCYAARPNTMVFCSRPEYIELLKYIDTDVLELTGNHINDYGSKWFDYSLDIYDGQDIQYFGGGKNIKDALKPAIFDINGTRFAFIGANPAGPSYAWATENTSGSAPVNTLSDELKEQDFKKYEDKIRLLKNQGYIVIFTFQYFENYSYGPTSQQAIDFKRMAEAGADIVSGSQAHQPQGFEITDNSFICYGLGNIFFGQALGKEVKQGIIAKHIFYKGMHINTELITTFIEDFSQPRLTTGMERAELLNSVFEGSIK